MRAGGSGSATHPTGKAHIIVNAETAAANSTDGHVLNTAAGAVHHATTWPTSGRRTLARLWNVTSPAEGQPARIRHLAHELGHAIGWPHSYLNSAYSNPMDIMSGGGHSGLFTSGLFTGTIGYNLYTAGWITPEAATTYGTGKHIYQLTNNTAGSGTRLIVINTGTTSHLYTLDYRNAIGADSRLAAYGVEAYEIDSRSTACDQYWLDGGTPCLGSSTRIQPAAETNVPATDHVHPAGDTFTITTETGVVTVTVDGTTNARAGGVATVTVDDGRTRGRFSDDDTNPHEADIETLAEAGIITGYPDGTFRGAQPITRVETAELLSVTFANPVPTGAASFTGVDTGLWYSDALVQRSRGSTPSCRHHQRLRHKPLLSRRSPAA